MTQPKNVRLVTEATADAKYVTFVNGTFYLNGVAVFTPGTSGTTTASTGGTTTSTNGLFSETFAGVTNGAAWPATHWTTALNTGGTIDVQNEAGRLLTSASGAWPGRVFLNGVSATVDRDLTFTVDRTALGGTLFFVFRHDQSSGELGGSPEPYNGYYLTIGDTSITFNTSVNGVHSTIGTASTITALTSYRVRVRYVGTELDYKFWAPTAAEPSTWAYTGTDSTFAVATNPYISTYVTSSTNMAATIDDFVVNS